MIKARIEALRLLMKRENLAAYIINSADPHLSEYVADRWQVRKWISGFSGSAGTIVITQEQAGLWTDGRYFIQAENELKGSGIDLYKMAQPNIPTFTKWIFDTLSDGDKVGFDGKAFSVQVVEKFQKTWSAKKLQIEIKKDLIDEIWLDRPAPPNSKAVDHLVEFAGVSRQERFSYLRKKMEKPDLLLATSLSQTAWLFNLRGNDVNCVPVIMAYGLLDHQSAHLFIESYKLSSELKNTLVNDGVTIHNYDDIYEYIAGLSEVKNILYPENSTNFALYSAIPAKLSKKVSNLIILEKSKKNIVEITNLKKALEIDCLAITKFLCWLKYEIGNSEIDEISATEKLLQFRQQSPEFLGISFNPISAYAANAAMMHYAPQPDSKAILKPCSFYLIDSGGQYKYGTTDITRTIALGELSSQQKRDFTLVLKGVIELSQVRFLKGSTGANLDILARRHLWNIGIDYKCGTGHGVGSYLSVHEGPQNFSQHMINIPFELGMVTTVEPGVYLEDLYGIRTENMLLTVADGESEFGSWYKFDTLNYCPIDIEAIDKDLLSVEEIKWINDYHQKCRELYTGKIPENYLDIFTRMTEKI